MPASLRNDLSGFLVLLDTPIGGRTDYTIKLIVSGDAGVTILLEDETIFENLSGGDIVAGVVQAIELALINDETLGYLSAGLLSRGGRGILVVGSNSELVDYVVASMVCQNFVAFGQGLVSLNPNNLRAAGIPFPLAVDINLLTQDRFWQNMQDRRSVLGSRAVYIAPDDAIGCSERSCLIELVVVVSRSSGAHIRAHIPASDEVFAALNGKASPLALQYLSRHLETTPVLAIDFSQHRDLTDGLELMSRLVLDGGLVAEDLARIQSMFSTTAVSPPIARAIPERSDRRLNAKMTVGMATFDDYDGVYFSIQSIRLHHPEVLDQVEFVVIDNNPQGISASHLKDLEKKIPNYRYIPIERRTGTAVRNVVFDEAAGEFILCMDSHVLFEAGAIASLLRYFEANPQTSDLIQGPMIWENMANSSSHWDERWRNGMFGEWGADPRAADRTAEPFDIPMQGLGVFACRREAWPGFNRSFKGFGGEEGYIHTKFRQRGGRTLCLPSLRWMHRFARPRGVPYSLKWNDRFRNYLLGRQELGLPIDDVLDHMRDYFGEQYTAELLDYLRASGDVR